MLTTKAIFLNGDVARGLLAARDRDLEAIRSQLTTSIEQTLTDARDRQPPFEQAVDRARDRISAARQELDDATAAYRVAEQARDEAKAVPIRRERKLRLEATQREEDRMEQYERELERAWFVYKRAPSDAAETVPESA